MKLRHFCCTAALLCLAAGATAQPPRADDPFWRDSIPAAMRQSYIARGERMLGQPWTSMPATVFAEFKTSGNRTNFEALTFAKRRQLAHLVMAEVAEGQGRFVPAIVDGLLSICEETWWGLPAHYGTKVPRPDDQNVDLFNAETAGLLAWTVYMLQRRLDDFSPLIADRVHREVERRMLRPALEGDYWWKRASMNWNPWICSNWLACVVLCEGDTVRRQQAIGQIRRCAETFASAYPADGGCDEGPAYWDRAAASLFEVVSLMQQATGDDGRRWAQGLMPRLRAMGSFVYKTYIADGYCVNFADAHGNRLLQQVNVVYPYACYVDDPVMRSFAAYIGQRADVLHRAADVYDRSGNYPALGRELGFLRCIGSYLRETPQEPRPADTWLPDLQVMTARRGGLYVAVKGGHNDESHNHNDVGSFIVYATPQPGHADARAEPLLVDPGVGEYTQKTFSADRYSIWTMQSAYHNLPLINGCPQHQGRDHRATVLRHADGLLQMELAEAYTAEAAVSSWRRTVSIGRRGVSITEDYELSHWREPTCLVLLSAAEPRLLKPGTIALGSHRLLYDGALLDAATEDLAPLLDPLLQRDWDGHLYRIVLTVRRHDLKGRLRYVVE